MEDALQCPDCSAAIHSSDVHCRNCGHSLSSTGTLRIIGSTVLGQYEVLDVLGQGGMSVVYKARHNVTGQEVALKLLPPELAAFRDLKDRFLEEGKALAKLDHPNIVHLYNFGSERDCLVLAMQFVRGKTWERLILDAERLPWRRSVELARDVAKGLAYAHQHGIIHRDMKPSNVLVREHDGAATIMDFGIAKVQSSTRLTATGQTMGTVRYMSPEQVVGQGIEPQTDIYSLAMTLYESLVGDTAFDGDTHFEIMRKHLNERPPRPSERGIELPPGLESVVMKALAKKPEERQGGAAEFEAQLVAVLEGRGVQIADTVTDTPSLGLEPKAEETLEIAPATSRKGMAALGIVLAAAAGVTAFLTLGDPDPTKPQRQTNSASDETPVAPADPYAKALLLPEFDYALDRIQPDLKVRVVSVQNKPEAQLITALKEGRAIEAAVAKTLKSPAGEVDSFVTIVFVPPEGMCSRLLYQDSPASQENCASYEAWYLPSERTLYIADGDESDWTRLVASWLPSIRCVHSRRAQSCQAEIEAELEKAFD